MCGRYTVTHTAEQIWEEFDLEGEPGPLARSFNVAPTARVPVVASDAPRRLSLMRWGLVPSWAEDPRVGARMINARREGLAQRRAFRSALRARRCLVVASGFYEWTRLPGGGKQPMYFSSRDGAPLALAGLWERWWDSERVELRTFTVVTTGARGPLEGVHHRMPCVLPRPLRGRWLATGRVGPEELDALLDASPVDALHGWEVGARVNSVRHDDAACIEPVRR